MSARFRTLLLILACLAACGSRAHAQPLGGNSKTSAHDHSSATKGGTILAPVTLLVSGGTTLSGSTTANALIVPLNSTQTVGGLLTMPSASTFTASGALSIFSSAIATFTNLSGQTITLGGTGFTYYAFNASSITWTSDGSKAYIEFDGQVFTSNGAANWLSFEVTLNGAVVSTAGVPFSKTAYINGTNWTMPMMWRVEITPAVGTNTVQMLVSNNSSAYVVNFGSGVGGFTSPSIFRVVKR